MQRVRPWHISCHGQIGGGAVHCLYTAIELVINMVKVAENRVIDLDVFPGDPRGDKLAEQTK